MQASTLNPLLQSEAMVRFGNHYTMASIEKKKLIITNIFNEVMETLALFQDKDDFENKIALNFKSIILRLYLIKIGSM